jgi:hypothetical protein
MDRDILIARIKSQKTRPIFPQVYDDFLEIDELSKGEDALIDPIINAVFTALNDKNISTAGRDKIAQFEEKLSIDPSGLNINQRRQQVVDFINKSKVFNGDRLLELIQSLADGEEINVDVDPVSLVLRIWQDETTVDDTGTSLAQSMTHKILPIIPQNISIQAEIYTEMDTNSNYTSGMTCTYLLSMKAI